MARAHDVPCEAGLEALPVSDTALSELVTALYFCWHHKESVNRTRRHKISDERMLSSGHCKESKKRVYSRGCYGKQRGVWQWKEQR